MGTLSAFREYARLYPNGKYITEINDRIESSLWYSAKSENTLSSYKQYLQQSKCKTFEEEATSAIVELNSQKRWKAIKFSGSEDDIKEFINQYPNSSCKEDAQKRISELEALAKTNDEQQIAAEKSNLLVFAVKGVSFEMAKVEAGTFTMGATSEMTEPYSDEKPTHEVTLTNNYYLGKTEVTQALWKAVMENSPSGFDGDEKPVEQVSWYDCQKFISKLNSATGKNFRLPTEAEWEFAARGGNNSRHYRYGGSDILDDVVWYEDNCGDTTHDVAMKQPNELGLYDMGGNVLEWCFDWYGSYSSTPQNNPMGSNSGTDHVARGGSFYFDARHCRSSQRMFCPPDCRRYDLGLRLALSE